MQGITLSHGLHILPGEIRSAPDASEISFICRQVFQKVSADALAREHLAAREERRKKRAPHVYSRELDDLRARFPFHLLLLGAFVDASRDFSERLNSRLSRLSPHSCPAQRRESSPSRRR